MFKAKNGKRFGSIFAGKHYDENHTEDGMHSEGKPEDKAMPEMNEEQPEEKMGEESNVDGAQVASEHGLLTKLRLPMKRVSIPFRVITQMATCTPAYMTKATKLMITLVNLRLWKRQKKRKNNPLKRQSLNPTISKCLN